MFWHRSHRPIDMLEGHLLLGIGNRFEAQRFAADRCPEHAIAGNHIFEAAPPQLAISVGNRRGNEDGKWASMATEYRPSMDKIIAITIIDGEHCERPRRSLRARHPAHRL